MCFFFFFNFYSISKDDEKIVLLSDTVTTRREIKSLAGSDISEKKTLHSVSYMDGPQRIVAFTINEALAQEITHKEASNMEIFVKISGVRLSIINNMNLEIALISIAGSKPYWNMVNEQQETKVTLNFIY